MTGTPPMAKLICEVVVQGETVVRALTTIRGIVPTLVKTTPGVGKPFWFWETIPAGKVVAADFTDAPIATNDATVNSGLMAEITATPHDVLVYDPPLAP